MNRLLSKIILLMALAGLSACAETELVTHVFKDTTPPQGTFKVGNPYRIDGQIYTPRETYTYTETGIASWYGPGFHGKKTANGEKFDKNELTAAHRTLQMPSLVKVTNLKNGRSLVVRVNDRGPFSKGRVIDVSQKAAELLGFRNEGTARVRLDLLADESRTIAMSARSGMDTAGMEIPANTGGYQQASLSGQPAPGPYVPGHLQDGRFLPNAVVAQEAVRPTGIYIQTGSFARPENARGLAERLHSFGTVRIKPSVSRGQNIYRVQIGPLPGVPEADTLQAALARSGHADAMIVVDQ